MKKKRIETWNIEHERLLNISRKIVWLTQGYRFDLVVIQETKQKEIEKVETSIKRKIL